MNLLTIKTDKAGNLIWAKSRIVVLGNLEQRVWSNEDKYAPVLSGASTCLLILMAVEDGRKLKQGDCKNAFCNSKLREDEICIIRPPQNSPLKKCILETKQDSLQFNQEPAPLVHQDLKLSH